MGTYHMLLGRTKVLLMSTRNICFRAEIRKIFTYLGPECNNFSSEKIALALKVMESDCFWCYFRCVKIMDKLFHWI